MKLFMTSICLFLCTIQVTAQTEDTTGTALVSDAMFQFMIGNFEESEMLADKAIKLNPKLSKAYYFRGRSKTVLKRYDEALKDLEQGIKLAPDDPSMYYGKGLALFSKEDYEKALQAFATCLAKDSDFTEAHEFRGKTMMRQENYIGAIVEYDQWLSMAKYDQDEVYFELGRAHYLNGDEGKGCEYLRKAREMGHPTVHELILGVCPEDETDASDEVWKSYTDEKTVTPANAASFKTRENTPESIVRYFYASRMLGDQRWKEVIPSEADRSSRLKSELNKYDGWLFVEMKLISKMKNEAGNWWIKIDMKIKINGQIDGGEDEVEVKQLPDGTWIIIDVPT